MTEGQRGQGSLDMPTPVPGLALRVLLEGMNGGPRVLTDRPKSNQMDQGPLGAVEPFVTVICPAAKITNTFFSEGPAATGLRALMPPSCGHSGLGAQGRNAQSWDLHPHTHPEMCSVA